MVCMCWDTDAAMKANGEFGGMTGTTSAGLLAAQAGVRTLVLTHINSHLDSPGVREEGIRDVATVFDGEIVFGEELLSLDVSRSREATVPLITLPKRRAGCVGHERPHPARPRLQVS